MRVWETVTQIIPYSLEEVVSVFWDRYPNSKAAHILSEDVLERQVDGDKITTRKLIVKKGATFLKAAPKWMSRLTSVQVVPTLEESIYDRATRKLTTYTRNVAWNAIFNMHERAVYTPGDSQRPHIDSSLLKTAVDRAVYIDVNYGTFDPLLERVFLMSFRKSIKKTVAGFLEKLEERYGQPHVTPSLSGALISQKAASIKEKIKHMQNNKIGFEKA